MACNRYTNVNNFGFDDAFYSCGGSGVNTLEAGINNRIYNCDYQNGYRNGYADGYSAAVSNRGNCCNRRCNGFF